MSHSADREPEPTEMSYTPPGAPAEWRKYFDEEDVRWNAREQRLDWLRLLLMVVIYLAVMLPIYFLEPGLR